jgi:hypothetical protein
MAYNSLTDVMVQHPAREYIIALRFPYADELRSALESTIDLEQVWIKVENCITVKVGYRGESGAMPLLLREQIGAAASGIDQASCAKPVKEPPLRPSAVIPRWDPAA